MKLQSPAVILSVMSVMLLCCRLWPNPGNAIFGELQVNLCYDLSFTLNRAVHCEDPRTTFRNFEGFLEPGFLLVFGLLTFLLVCATFLF